MSDGSAFMLATVLLVLPAALGWLGGARVWAGGARAFRVGAAVLTSVAAAVVALSAWPTLAVWDAVQVVVVFSAALLLRGLGTRRALVVVVSSCLGLACAELVVRVAGVPLPAVGSPGEARLLFHVRDPVCEFDFAPPGFVASARHGREGPTVLYVGDSMLEGLGVPKAQAIVPRLASLRPSLRHVDAGRAGAGPDDYLVAVRQWSAEVRPEAVLVFVFTGNDLDGIGGARACCGCRPLVDFSDPRLPPGCDAPAEDVPAWLRLAKGAPPYSVRVFASVSKLAAAFVRVFAWPGEWVGRGVFGACEAWPTDGFDANVARLEASLRVLNDEGAAAGRRTGVVVLPYRPTLHRALGVPVRGPDVHGDEGRARHERVVEVARRAGLPVLDLWSPVLDGFRTEGASFFVESGLEDVHFSASGNARVAAEVAPFVDAVLEGR